MSVAKRFEELLTWQLLYELSLGVWAFTREPHVSGHFKYCHQIRDSADSSHRNVAEGFGRYNPTEFARFLDVVRGSAEETRAMLQTARDQQFISDERFAALDTLAVRGLQATARFQRYLRSEAAKRNAARWRHKRADDQRPSSGGSLSSGDATK